MEWFAQFGRRLQQLFGRKQWENDLAEEMRLHVDLRSAERSAHGVSPLDADSEARKRFGNATILREQSRGAWGWTTVETCWQDLR